MTNSENASIKARIDKMRPLSAEGQGLQEYFDAANLAQTVLYDTVGGNHPLMANLTDALQKGDWQRSAAAARGVITLYDQGRLTSPRLAIAHEIEGDLLDIAQGQLQAAERSQDSAQKQVQLAIAAFLAGAALEDALRRIATARGLQFDAQRTSLSKLQTALYQPSNQIEVINSSENKQITTWGDTRNKADHGKFHEITQSEVMGMVVGVRGFLDRHLP